MAVRLKGNKLRGSTARSVSIQNNESMAKQTNPSESNISVEDAGQVLKGDDKGDLMELISEEEASVCRSEGSPARKAKRGRVMDADAVP